MELRTARCYVADDSNAPPLRTATRSPPVAGRLLPGRRRRRLAPPSCPASGPVSGFRPLGPSLPSFVSPELVGKGQAQGWLRGNRHGWSGPEACGSETNGELPSGGRAGSRTGWSQLSRRAANPGELEAQVGQHRLGAGQWADRE